MCATRGTNLHVTEAQAADLGLHQQRPGGTHQWGDWLWQDHTGAAVHFG